MYAWAYLAQPNAYGYGATKMANDGRLPKPMKAFAFVLLDREVNVEDRGNLDSHQD